MYCQYVLIDFLSQLKSSLNKTQFKTETVKYIFLFPLFFPPNLLSHFFYFFSFPCLSFFVFHHSPSFSYLLFFYSNSTFISLSLLSFFLLSHHNSLLLSSFFFFSFPIPSVPLTSQLSSSPFFLFVYHPNCLLPFPVFLLVYCPISAISFHPFYFFLFFLSPILSCLLPSLIIFFSFTLPTLLSPFISFYFFCLLSCPNYHHPVPFFFHLPYQTFCLLFLTAIFHVFISCSQN
ncbi:unnamed protein product [Acanthosepion pharaonis]|uniref:Uncharacterized protein n=1 Tax=Acanthosepion pharaonis TaxID=158019 RepID=A0A812C7Q1_ACAPH|nr:unnamed protein product [Sepia pharaonis]